MKNLLAFFLFFTLFGLAGCAQQTTSQATRHVAAADAKRLIEQNPDLVLLDVRTPDEFSQGHVQGARNLDFYAPNFEQQLTALDSTKTYLLYCASGNRSGKAAKMLEGHNFGTVYNSTAGFQELKSAGVPVK